MGGSDTIIFTADLFPYDRTKSKSLGIYQFDLQTKEFRQIAGSDYLLNGLSPDGQYILAVDNVSNSVSNVIGLYIIRIADGQATKIADNVSTAFFYTMYWHPNDLIAFIGLEYGINNIFTVRPDGSELTKISHKGLQPLEIFPSYGQSRICWASGYKRGCFHLHSEKLVFSLLMGRIQLT